MTNTEPVDILIVEDSDIDRAAIVAVLQASVPAFQVVAVRDGTEAMDFLFARGAYRDRVGEDPPRLILLDLEMPGADGFAVLKSIWSLKPENALTITPVVVFTDSPDAIDIHKSYQCGANSYSLKPVRFHDFQAVAETIGRYWIKHNERSALAHVQERNVTSVYSFKHAYSGLINNVSFLSAE